MFWYLASSSMIMPKERFGRRSIGQRKVKWSLGASSCSRWSTSEVWDKRSCGARRPRLLLGCPPVTGMRGWGSGSILLPITLQVLPIAWLIETTRQFLHPQLPWRIAPSQYLSPENHRRAGNQATPQINHS